MKIATYLDGTTLTAIVEGRIDTTTAPQFEREIGAALTGVTDVVLDFEKVEYISSAGLRVILSLQKTMNKQGTLKLKHPNEVLMEIFEVTGFTDILTIEP